MQTETAERDIGRDTGRPPALCTNCRPSRMQHACSGLSCFSKKQVSYCAVQIFKSSDWLQMRSLFRLRKSLDDKNRSGFTAAEELFG